jgi:hypothetical protein
MPRLLRGSSAMTLHPLAQARPWDAAWRRCPKRHAGLALQAAWCQAHAPRLDVAGGQGGAPRLRGRRGAGGAMRGLQHSPFTPFRCTIRTGAGCRQARAAVRKPPAHQRRRAAPVHGGGDMALCAALGRRLALVHLGGKAQRAQALLQAGARRSDAEKQRGHSTRPPCPASAHAPPQHLRMLLPSTGACCCGVGRALARRPSPRCIAAPAPTRALG